MARKKHMTGFYEVNIFMPILLGVLVYFYLRPDTWISKVICSFLGIEWPDYFQKILPNEVSLFFRNYVCDGLWAYALTFAVSAVTKDIWNTSFPILLICILFEVAIEFAQKFGIICGTFDVMDIVLEICMTALATLIIKMEVY